MQARVLGLIGLAIVVGTAVWLKTTRFSDPSPDTVYYFPGLLFFAIAGAALLGRGIASRSARARTGGLADGDDQSTRETFRIEYPEDLRPKLQAEVGRPGASKSATFVVIDVSEEGARILKGEKLQMGEMLWGKLLFPSGNEANVAGRVVWTQGREAGVQFSKIVPPAMIVDEQLKLRPHLRSRADATPAAPSTP
jgi:hypothetical protein